MPAAREQAALPDQIIITKSNLVDRARTGRLLERLAALPPSAAIAANGAIAASMLDEPPPPLRTRRAGYRPSR